MSPRPRQLLLLAPALAGSLLAACSAGGTSSGALADATTTTEAADALVPTTTTAPAVAIDDALNGFVPEPFAWIRCGDGLECARLDVPIDWDVPDGATIELNVARYPATGGEPRGAVITNPGGPGASGVEFITGGVFSDDVTEVLDTISWDPRGVAGTEPLGCSGDELTTFIRMDGDPDSPEEAAALDDAAQAMADRCAAESPELLPNLGTGSVARDLEAIRRAYAAPTSYIGFSYGTAIGLEYLELFPGAMPVVLDGVIDPSIPLTEMLRNQAVAFDREVAAMLASCSAGQEGCPRGGAAAAYDALAAQIDAQPLQSGVDLLGPSDLVTAALVSVYDESSWPLFLLGLAAAQDGDGSILMQLSVGYRFFTSYAAYWAVECLDSQNPVGSEAWTAFAAELEALSSRFGPSIANEMRPCAFWPVPPDPVTGPVVAEGAGPVVVIGTTGDAATPFEQAQQVADTLADGRLVAFDGHGHTAYGDSACVQDVVSAFVLDGIAPADGTRC